MRVTPFWLSYAVVLVALYLWARSLVNEMEQPDDDTADREGEP